MLIVQINPEYILQMHISHILHFKFIKHMKNSHITKYHTYSRLHMFIIRGYVARKFITIIIFVIIKFINVK